MASASERIREAREASTTTCETHGLSIGPVCLACTYPDSPYVIWGGQWANNGGRSVRVSPPAA